MADEALTSPTRAESRTTAGYATPLTAAAVDHLENALGGRRAFIAALTHAPAQDDLAYVVGLIADPRMDARKLSAICRAGRVTVGELLEAFKQGAYAKMYAEVTAQVTTETPRVVADVLRRAQVHEVTCETCRGTGTTPGATPDAPTTPCASCTGTGVQTILPDLDRQKVALELAGLLNKRAPLVAVDNRKVQVSDTSIGGFEKLIAATDKSLFRVAPARTHPDHETVIDADVTPTRTDSVDTGDSA